MVLVAPSYVTVTGLKVSLEGSEICCAELATVFAIPDVPSTKAPKATPFPLLEPNCEGSAVYLSCPPGTAFNQVSSLKPNEPCTPPKPIEPPRSPITFVSPG